MKCSRIGMLLVLGLGRILTAEDRPYTFTSLIPPFPAGSQSTATGINDLGTIVGAINSSGFVGEKEKYTALNVPGSTFTQADGINFRGDIVGVYIAGQGHGFILQGTVFTTIDFPGTQLGETAPFGINSRGDIVGYYILDETTRPFEVHGFLRERDHFTTIDVPFPGVYNTFANGINDRGEIVGEYQQLNGGTHGFLKRGSDFQIIDVPFPGAVATIARGINNKGEIVGLYIDSSTTQHAFLLSKGVFTRIDPSFPDVTVLHTNAWGINDLGEIVGFYYIPTDSSFQYIGYLAKPVRAGQ
jgi:probable HAF family extracellular repeat protein